ncbi:MAG: PAS domain S-box protein, partial [Gramella sp.]|nr:PAS domain S-box protein [Christiangramia sp.]
MNQDPTLQQSVAIITYSYEHGVCAYNIEAEKLFHNFWGQELRSGNCFLKDFDANYRQQLVNKLELCRSGTPQELPLKYQDTVLRISLIPVLGDNNFIDKATILIDLGSEIDKEVISDNYQADCKSHDSEYSKQVFSNLFYNNPDAVFSFDLEGNFVNANNRSVELAETPLQNLLNMHFLPFIPEDNHEKVTGHFHQALRGNHQRYITSFQSTKGTFRWLEISNLPITSNGEIVGVYGIAKDITEKKLTEKKILEERQMLRAIIDNIPDYIFVKDREHKSILSNRKFYQQILGKSQDDSHDGFTPVDYFDYDKGEKIIADNEWVMTSGKAVINRPDTVTNIDGNEEKVLLTKVPLKNQKEEIIGLVGIARDITATYLHNKKQEIVFKAIKAFGDNPTFQNAMIKVLKIFCEELGYDYAESYKVSVNNQKLIRAAFWPSSHDLNSESSLYEKGVGLPGMVWQSGKVKVLRKDTDDNLLDGMCIDGKGTIATAVGFPIIFEGKLISIFCLGSIEKKKKIETEFLDDITLQIASAIERKRSQEQLNDFFEYSPNLIAVIGLDGFIKKINPSFTEKFGYTECEILTKPLTDFIHTEDLKKTYEAVEKVSVGGSDFEIKCRKKNGEY